MGVRRQAFIVVPLIVLFLISVFGVIGYYMGHVLGMPSRLRMPPAELEGDLAEYLN